MDDEETTPAFSRLADVAIWLVVGAGLGVFWREAAGAIAAAFH